MIRRKIAVPVNDNILCTPFERSRDFLIFSIAGRRITKVERHTVPVKIPDCPAWLSGNGVSDLITRNIMLQSVENLNVHKISVFVGVKERNPRLLVDQCIHGTLETFDTVKNELPVIR